MLAYEHSDHVVLRERVLLKLLLAFVLVHLLILGLEFLGTATVVARKPPDVRKEGLEIGKNVLSGLLSQHSIFVRSEVVAHLLESDHRYEVEIEHPIDLDPLQPDEVVARTQWRSQLAPQVLRDEVVLVLAQRQLHLQPIQFLVAVELILQRLQSHSEFTNILLLVSLNQREDVLQESQRLAQLLLLLRNVEAELNREKSERRIAADDLLHQFQ